MVKRSFYVALGVPRGADPESVYVAYRKVVARYQEALDDDQPGAAPMERFAVKIRTYSERRHTGQFDDPEPPIPERGETDVDRFFDGLF